MLTIIGVAESLPGRRFGEFSESSATKTIQNSSYN